MLRSAGDGSYQADLDADWQIAGRLNGGYLLSLAGCAALAELGDGFEHPLVASAHYLDSPEPGPASLTVRVLRRGRRTAQTSVALATSSGPSRGAGHLRPSRRHRAVLRRRPPAGTAARAGLRPVARRGARLPRPADGGSSTSGPTPPRSARGEASGHGELRGWFRFEDGREPDTLSLLTVVDALPPASFDLGISGWVPTLGLTCLRAARRRRPARSSSGSGRGTSPADGSTRSATSGDSTGRLVATGHQLAGVRHS